MKFKFRYLLAGIFFVLFLSATESFSQIPYIRGTLTIKGYPKGAHVYINNEWIGQLPVDRYSINEGLYKIRVTAPGYRSHYQLISISNNAGQIISVKLEQKSKRNAFVRSFLLPGWGQYYIGNKGNAILFPILETISLFGALSFNRQYNDAIRDYNQAKDSYAVSITEKDLNRYSLAMETTYNDIDSKGQMRKIFIGAVAGIWLWNLVDVVFFGPAVQKENKYSLESSRLLKLSAKQMNGDNFIGITYDF